MCISPIGDPRRKFNIACEILDSDKDKCVYLDQLFEFFFLVPKTRFCTLRFFWWVATTELSQAQTKRVKSFKNLVKSEY